MTEEVAERWEGIRRVLNMDLVPRNYGSIVDYILRSQRFRVSIPRDYGSKIESATLHIRHWSIRRACFEKRVLSLLYESKLRSVRNT
jgi:hypothetical protein